MRTTNTGRRLKTVESSLAVLDAIQDSEGKSIRDIAAELELAESTIHGHVLTLERHGYLVKEDRRYHLGTKFLTMGGFVRQRREEYQLIGDRVEELAEETGERVQFIVEEHGMGTYMYVSTGDQAVQMDARLGKQSRLHLSAAGKAVLSNYSRDRVEAIVERRGLPKSTEHTIVDFEELLEELRRSRERGYTLNMEESVEGLRAVGSAVEVDDEVLGAISISGPTHRLEGDWLDELPGVVRGVTNELSLNIEYQ